MKKLFIPATALALVAFTSCSKLGEYVKDHLDGDDKTYRIEKWERDTSIADNYTGTEAVFSYNKNNDPISVIFNASATGSNSTQWKFIYDKHNRLSECYMYYNNNIYFNWSKYQYNNKGQIISDSTFEGGIVGSYPEPELFFYYLHDYTYDSKGRIVKIVQYEPGSPPMESYFNYEGNGNLVRRGYVYDNKMNFMRTNKVWMFINRDYSVNNAIPATSYNSAHLPLTFDADLEPGAGAMPWFLRRTFYKSTFTYKKVK